MICTIKLVATAQTYPVRVFTNMVSPYSLRLSDYETSDRLFATILFNDPVKVELTVKFKLIIEGEGITIQTKPEFNPAPYFLESGIPERLSSVDLSEYFNPDNLNFLGADKSAFLKTGLLPEGVYRISIEVYEYTQNKKVSNSGRTTAWMVLNDPPIINYPKNFEKLNIREPQQIIFNWTPRHTGSPNAAFSTEYEFELVEMRVGVTNANFAIQTLPPIFTMTTQQTSLIYGLAETALIPGQQYAFRVRAKPTIENEHIDLFKNKGYSEVFTFTYGDECLPPTNIVTEQNGAFSFKTEWTSAFNHTSFIVNYKEDLPDANWYEEKTTDPSLEVFSLVPNTTYLVKVTAECDVITSEQTDDFSVKTKEVLQSEFVCGNAEDAIDFSNKTLLKNLAVNEEFYSGNFKVKVKELEDSKTGTFSGTGIATIPWFQLARIKVAFKDIKINEERIVIEGNVTSVQSENSRWVYVPEKKEEPVDVESDNSVGDDIDEDNITLTDTTGGSEIADGVVADSTGILLDENGEVVDGNNVADSTSVAGNEGVETEDGVAANDESNDGSVDGVSGGSVNGGNSTGGPGDNTGSTSNTWDIEAGEFGPIQVAYANTPELVEETNGDCSYEVNGSFQLSLDEIEGASLPVDFETVTIEYTVDCESRDLASATFNWSSSQDELTASFGLMEAEVEALTLSIDKDKNIEGSVSVNAALSEDVSLSNSGESLIDLTLKKGVKGQAQFSLDYSSSDSKLNGTWDFSGIEGINLDLTNGTDVVAQFKNASLNEEGIASGNLTIKKPFIRSTENYTASLTFKSLDVAFSPFKGFESWKINAGTIEATLSDMKNIEGEITSELVYENDRFTANASSENLSGFGMDIKNIDLTTNFSKEFEFETIEGSFSVKHPEFGAEISVSEFEFLPTGLENISLSGEFTYADYTVNLKETVYEKSTGKLNGSATLISGNGSDQSELNIEYFRIDTEGNIEIGPVTGSIVTRFGPLAVTMDLPAATEKDADGFVSYTDVKGSFELAMKQDANEEKEKSISEATLSFKLNPETKAYKDVEVTWLGELAIGKVGAIDATIKQIDLEVDGNGNLSGMIRSAAVLEEDVSTSALLGRSESSTPNLELIVHKGLEGDIEFHFEGGNNFSGEWKLNKLSNISGDLKKKDSETNESTIIASFTEGNIDKAGVFSGHLQGTEEATYQNKQCRIGLSDLDMDFSVSLKEGMSSFDVLNGSGVLTVSEMQNVTGSLVFNLNVDEEQFVATVNQEDESTISAFTMQLSDLSLTTVFNKEFDLVSIEGSGSASHEKFNTALTVNDFKITPSGLELMNLSGEFSYKDYTVKLTETIYERDKALLNGSASLLSGPEEDRSELEVEYFNIDAEGNVEIGPVYGSLFSQFGPLAVTMDIPKATEKDADGFVTYTDVKGSFELGMEQEGEESKEASISEATLSFKLNPDTKAYKEVHVIWEGEIAVGTVGAVSATIKKLDLNIDEEGDISGIISSTASLEEDVSASSLFGKEASTVDLDLVVHKGLEGDVEFHFAGGEDFSGEWKLNKLSNISGDLKKKDSETNESTIIASFTEGNIDKAGVFSGHLQGTEEATYQNKQCRIGLSDLDMDFSVSLKEGMSSFDVLNGSGVLTVSEMQNVTGSLVFNLNVDEEQFVATVNQEDESTISAFTMQLSDLSLTTVFNKEFDLVSIEGSGSASHEKFNTALTVNDFKITPSGLELMNLSGEFSYKDYTVKLTETIYERDKALLNGSASLLSGPEEDRSELEVEYFNIDAEGNVEIGPVYGSLFSQFGPLAVTMDIPKATEKDADGFVTYTDVKGSFELGMEQEGEESKEASISEATLSFKLNPDTKAYKEVHVIWEGEIAVGTVGAVSATIKKLDLNIDEEGDISGIISSTASLEEDVSASSLFGKEASTADLDLVVYKGLEGDVEFHFAGGEDFSGEWKLTKLENLSGDLKKTDSETNEKVVIAAFSEGNYGTDKTFSGRLQAKTNAAYHNNHFKVALSDLDMTFSVSMEQGMSSFVVTEGSGLLTVSEIDNVEGEFNFDLDVNETEIRAGVSQSEESTVSAFNMQLSELSLNTVFDRQFNLLSMQGSVKAAHEEFENNNINITNFEINNGALTAFEGSGSADYKGFQFDLKELNYSNSSEGTSLLASAEVVMKLGKSAQSMSVDKFEIDNEGAISVGEIAGDFERGSAMALHFKATFNEQQLAGLFDGKLGMMSLEGKVDFGTAIADDQSKYNYGYLSITSSLGPAGIPIPPALKINKLGGQAGINYELTDVRANEGQPLKGSYVAGLTLGISDVSSKIFQLEGNTVVQVQEDKFKLDLVGDLNIPAKSPYLIAANLDVAYEYPAGTLSGSASIAVRIPAKTGFILSATPSLAFDFQEDYWRFHGDNQALLFNTIAFNGSIDLRKEDDFSAHLIGELSYSKYEAYHTSIRFLTFSLEGSATLDLNCSASVDILFTDDELSSDLALNGSGTATLNVSGTFNYSGAVSVNGLLSVQTGMIWGGTTIAGELEGEIINDGESKEFTYDFKHKFE